MISFFLAQAAAAPAVQSATRATPGMPPMMTFFCGFVLLILFAWYIMCDADRAKRIVGTVLIVSLLAFCLQLVWPPFDVKDANGTVTKSGKITLGLDLQGGTSFLIQLMQPAEETPGSKSREITKD